MKQKMYPLIRIMWRITDINLYVGSNGSCDHKLLRNLRMFKVDMGCVVGPLSFIRTYSVRFIAAFTFFLSSLPVQNGGKRFSKCECLCFYFIIVYGSQFHFYGNIKPSKVAFQITPKKIGIL